MAASFIDEPQAVHGGPWFCVSSMACSRQFGVRSSPASQPAAVDLKGSDAMTSISTRSHLGHSNSRCSKPIGPGETRSSIIRAWQREQRGRSIAVKNCWDEDTMLPCVGRERYRLSVTDVCRWRGGDGTSMRFRVPEPLVNIAHFPEFNRWTGYYLKSARGLSNIIVPSRTTRTFVAL
jgi:hypothetical protein